MKRNWMSKPAIVVPIVALTFLLGIAPRPSVMANPSESTTSATQRYTDSRQRNEQAVREVLADEQVRAALAKRGVKAEDIEARLASLNDQQLQQLAMNIDHAKAGGCGEGVIIAIAVVAIVALFVWWFITYEHPHTHAPANP